MYAELPLPVTATNAGHEAKGTIGGVEPKAAIPIVISLPVTVFFEIFMVMVLGGGGLIIRIIVGLAPLVGTVAFVLFFIHKKPPNYLLDSIELWRGRIPIIGKLASPCGIAFNASPLTRGGVHPLLRAKKSLAGRD